VLGSNGDQFLFYVFLKDAMKKKNRNGQLEPWYFTRALFIFTVDVGLGDLILYIEKNYQYFLSLRP